MVRVDREQRPRRGDGTLDEEGKVGSFQLGEKRIGA
jgi:hypothetical protein